MSIIEIIRLLLFRRKYRKQNKHNQTSIHYFCDITKIHVGKNSYGTIYVEDDSASRHNLTIGNYCSLAGTHFLLGGEHYLNTITTYPFKCLKFNMGNEALSKGDIILGDDVWIGINTIICSGVKIGQGAVIGAGSVVTKDVAPYTIVAGNPAKIIRKRFPDELIDKLLSINICELFDNFSKDDINLIYSQLTECTLKEILNKHKK